MTVYPIRFWSHFGNPNDCVSNPVLVFFKPLIDCNYNLFVEFSKLRFAILELLYRCHEVCNMCVSEKNYNIPIKIRGKPPIK